VAKLRQIRPFSLDLRELRVVFDEDAKGVRVIENVRTVRRRE
jgi:hypothetical protein